MLRVLDYGKTLSEMTRNTGLCVQLETSLSDTNSRTKRIRDASVPVKDYATVRPAYDKTKLDAMLTFEQTCTSGA